MLAPPLTDGDNASHVPIEAAIHDLGKSVVPPPPVLDAKKVSAFATGGYGFQLDENRVGSENASGLRELDCKEFPLADESLSPTHRCR